MNRRTPLRPSQKPMKRTPIGEKRKAVQQNEKAFQQQVIDLATLLGWWCWHPYYASRSPAGYPDVSFYRERLIQAELKARRADGRMGKLTPEQVEMAHRCFKAGVEYYAWTPEDWPEIEEVLSRGGTVQVAR